MRCLEPECWKKGQGREGGGGGGGGRWRKVPESDARSVIARGAVKLSG